MDVKQSEEYRNAVINSAKGWVKGEYSIDNQMEIIVIADYYGIKLPLYFHNFMFSTDPNHVFATGAHKSILKKLGKIAEAIKEKEGMI